MKEYNFKNYDQSYLDQQIELVKKCTQSWTGFTYPNKDQLLQAYSVENFTPETRHYVFEGDKLVGFISSAYTNKEEGTANLQFPFVLSGYEEVEALLMQKTFDTFKQESIKEITSNLRSGWSTAEIVLGKYGFDNPKVTNRQLVTDTLKFNFNEEKFTVEFIEVDPVDHKDALIKVFATEMTQSEEEIATIIDGWKDATNIIMNTITMQKDKVVTHSMVFKNPNNPTQATMTHISVYDEKYLPRRDQQMKYMFQKLKEEGFETIRLFAIPEEELENYDTSFSKVIITTQYTKQLLPMQTV